MEEKKQETSQETSQETTQNNERQAKDLFIEIVNKDIHRDVIEKLMTWLSNTDFFTAPASTRFHGNHPGGLCVHSMNVYREFKHLLDVYENVFTNKLSDESIAIVSLFHDLCKANFYKETTRNVKNEEGKWISVPAYEIDEQLPFGDHADKSIIILQSFIKLQAEEIYCIRAHMGAFDCAFKGGSQVINKIFDKSKNAVLLHMADLISSNFYEG